MKTGAGAQLSRTEAAAAWGHIAGALSKSANAEDVRLAVSIAAFVREVAIEQSRSALTISRQPSRRQPNWPNVRSQARSVGQESR